MILLHERALEEVTVIGLGHVLHGGGGLEETPISTGAAHGSSAEQ